MDPFYTCLVKLIIDKDLLPVFQLTEDSCDTGRVSFSFVFSSMCTIAQARSPLLCVFVSWIAPRCSLFLSCQPNVDCIKFINLTK